jgi:hypothetical protein
MNPCAGILRCISLTYFAFNFLLPGRDEKLNFSFFADSLLRIRRKFKGESKI